MRQQNHWKTAEQIDLPVPRRANRINLETVYFGAVLPHLSRAMEPPTLAAKLGTTTHISPLLIKAKRLGLDPEALEHLAVQRGCNYYASGEPRPQIAVPPARFSNVELAIALLNPSLRYDPQSIRLGAAMLSAEGNTPEEIARLSILERSEPLVRYVAEAGRKFEAQNAFWDRLLELLPPARPLRSGVMPHITRFVAMTGFTRRGRETIVQWIRPCACLAHG